MNFLDLVKKRYSVRSYEERQIENEKMEYIMECVRLAPSAVNFQPWHFYVVTDSERLDALKSTYKREWIQSAPCIIVACANHEESWHRRSDNKDHADIDLAIAIEHLCLAAAEQGLGTCWVCNFDAALCHEVMAMPENVEPIALIPIGYTPDAEVPEKKRKTIEDICTYL
ncbi:nitroreductase family protein [Bacteroides caecigallinarum]|uniref:nitroreductase family protein n=1 Tax=Bacteroides caecigallinarum TaxID=1411144 RepID=UPI001F15F268|nr:nitroreductase family protein [Bacteroides caecigallinarum]MCF2592307.1 nitroreductase family protein [Bacteroides caecigallinarum]